MRLRRVIPTLAALLVSVSAALGADVVERPIGIEGGFVIRVTGPNAGALIAKPTEERPAVLIRIESSTSDGKPDAPAYLYDIRFMARRPGTHDLRDYLQFVDGASAKDLEPMPIRIATMLPPDDDLYLNDPKVGAASMSAWYRTLLIVVGVLWIVPLAFVVVRAIVRWKRRPLPPLEPYEPTLWDRLRPLLEKAATRTLTSEEQAHLEMIALGAWIDRLNLRHAPRATVMQRLREHDDSRPAVELLERWLHRPGGSIDEFKAGMEVLTPRAKPMPDVASRMAMSKGERGGSE